jgi:hypothetical protein
MDSYQVINKLRLEAAESVGEINEIVAFATGNDSSFKKGNEVIPGCYGQTFKCYTKTYQRASY